MDGRGLVSSRWGAMGIAFFALLVGVAVLHPEITLQGKIYTSADAQAAAAFTSLGKSARANGEVPLWNPFVFGGMPSYASLAYLPDVYPVTRPLRILVDTLGLPGMTWLLFHLLVLAGGVVFYLRSRGLPLAVCIAAGLWTLALPKLMAWGVHGHGTKIGTLAWLPWTLWCIERLFSRGRPYVAMLLAALWAMQLLRHHVQIFYYSGMVACVLVLAELFAAWRRRESTRAWLVPSGWVVLAAMLAMGAAALIYLPVWEYQASSIRGAASQGGGAAYDYATNWSLAPGELSTLIWPTAFGYGLGSYVGSMPFTDYPNYIGLPLLLLAALGFWKGRDRWGYAWLAVFLLSTLLSFGKHGAIYELFYSAAPFFKKFRVPAMILIVQELAVIFLAARGLDACVRLLRDRGRPAALLALGLGAVGAMLLLYGSVGSSALAQQHLDRWMSSRPDLPARAFSGALELAKADAIRLGLLALFAAGLATRWAQRLPRAAIALGLGLLWFFDLAAVSRPIAHPEDHLTRPARAADGVVWNPAPSMIRDRSIVATYVEDTELGRWLRGQEDRPRVWPIGHGARARDNTLAAQRVVSLGGYHAAKLKRYEELRRRIFEANPPAVRLVNLMAARWVLLEGRLDASSLDQLARMGMKLSEEPMFQSAEGVVYENRSALPRARLVTEVRTASDDPRVLHRIAAGEVDPMRTAFVDAEPEQQLGGDAAGATVELEDLGFDALRARVNTPVPALLVLADVYYPGWKATVDGESTELLRADYLLRGVVVPAGEHVVEMRFSGGSYARGRRIAAVSWILMPLVAAAGWWRARRATDGVEA